MNIKHKVFLIVTLCYGHLVRWYKCFLQEFPLQTGIFWTERLTFGHHIHKVLKPLTIGVLSHRPVVACTSVKGLPENGLGKGYGDESASGFQTVADLREERKREKRRWMMGNHINSLETQSLLATFSPIKFSQLLNHNTLTGWFMCLTRAYWKADSGYASTVRVPGATSMDAVGRLHTGSQSELGLETYCLCKGKYIALWHNKEFYLIKMYKRNRV